MLMTDFDNASRYCVSQIMAHAFRHRVKIDVYDTSQNLRSLLTAAWYRHRLPRYTISADHGRVARFPRLFDVSIAISRNGYDILFR
jgi:hypothetical protein